ncbi:hypothetical protein J4466_01945 [Candidatus Pacearchaeota archaeon]|nr:hypothetical protein [Candidatus Pacearchaeota archaeon]
MKKSLLILLFVVILSPYIVIAQSTDIKLQVTTTKESFQPGENITIKVALLDSQNSPINAEINLIFENAEKTKKIEKTIGSNTLIEIDLGEAIPAGYWSVIASYNGMESKAIFNIETSESAFFSLDNDMLTITNNGNSRYTKTIQILIGDTLGTKDVDLNVGEKVSFRLIAPDNIYNIRVTDGKTTLTRGNVPLTGDVIGVLDDRIRSRAPITGARIEGDSEAGALSLVKSNKIVYTFILVVVGAAVLIAIERNYRRKLKA